MKKSKKTMPKSINSKKNNKSNIKFLKELNGQVLVSVQQYQSHPELFLGTPGNLRLKDGREAIVSIVVRDKVFPLDRVANLLKSIIFFVAEVIFPTDDPYVKCQAHLDSARAFKVYCDIMELLDPGHMQDALDEIREFDEELYGILNDAEKVEHLVSISRSECESPLNPKIQFIAESIDVEYLSRLIEFGYKPLLCVLNDEFESDEEYVNFAFTMIVGCVMVKELQGMEREEAIECFLDEFGYHNKECAEFFFNMLTINKEA